ncbi:50S ribosomal protein L25/general stress protein Ctc [Ureibacillus chungkukjangi]|uniref:Large ribosomal subunit protein bL25 n=1 Tax=Ureibacillus chungkukjangi TaxID=1202712 RepID=A0A318TYB7_9BACL|nr:50S ribosomal protein L25/general stress protein Ctc [Ureibacillus chungkukjangi]MCM3389826.1 50S ribosomal protein L25/general stress protein Ctc [Ureibacillus chungkukjangi]PYF04639.1 large subunit ribosomal protein L25 [Ureibacillus chungkukjangi]
MDIILEAKPRETGAHSTLTKLRHEGQLPGVIYGYKVANKPVTLDYKEMAKAVQKFGSAGVFKIDLEGNQINAVLTDIQRCALKGTVKHVDLLSINMAEELEVDVPVMVIGEASGVKEGGVLMQPIRELKIKVKPSNIPESIEVDASNVGMNESISVAEIRSTVPFEILNADEDTLVSVTPPVVVNDDTAGQGDTENQDIKATEAPESES